MLLLSRIWETTAIVCSIVLVFYSQPIIQNGQLFRSWRIASIESKLLWAQEQIAQKTKANGM